MKFETIVLLATAMVCAPRAATAQTPAADTAALRKQMASAAQQYESTIRSRAPFRMMQNAFCDETVGRFCVVYDVGMGGSLPPEPQPVKQARAKVIEAFKRGAAVWPTDSTIVAPLIRYLIEDQQATEAIAVAKSFSETGVDVAWGQLLLGLAVHSSGDEAQAETHFARLLPQLLPSDRVRLHDASALLSKDEQEKYRALTGPERARYHERLWRLADPLYLTEGNESLIEHFSRRIYGHILAHAPAEGDVVWGPDVEQLTMRFGIPTSRTQNFGTGVGGKRLTEHFAPNQLTYVPPALITKPGLTPFEPGTPWPYDTIRSTSGYAPRTFRRMMVIEHQVARFPARDGGELRADYIIPVDSAVQLPAKFEVALFALDSTWQVVAEKRDTVTVVEPLTPRQLSMPLPAAGAAAYSLEAIDLGSRLASRARYLFPNRSADRPTLSDLVIMRASDAAPPSDRRASEFRPLATLILKQGDPIALYFEARGLTANASREVRYRVDLEVLEPSRPGVFSRAVTRLGRALGVAGDDAAPRISWNQQQNAAETTVIALKLGQVQLEPGLKQFKLTLTDVQTGAKASVERLLLVRR